MSDDAATTPATPGALLIADFQKIMMSYAVVEELRAEAQQLDQSLREQLNDNGSLLAGHLRLPAGTEDQLARISLGAQVRKLQTEEAQAMNAQQITQLERESMDRYRGKRVEILPMAGYKPIHGVWAKNGGYELGEGMKKPIRGHVSELLFSQNLMIVKPSLVSRALQSGRVAFAIEIIDPSNLEPQVELHI